MLDPRLIALAHRSWFTTSHSLLCPFHVRLWSEWALSLMLELLLEFALLHAHVVFFLPLLVILVEVAESGLRVDPSTPEIAALRDGPVQGLRAVEPLLEGGA
mmetsp:Transcript_14589/g.19750  ORF Transcript_14589/g.19750 Transcript_14589/m.19750 type:complete len:102 (-) Transcript_14589:31-336(-)